VKYSIYMHFMTSALVIFQFMFFYANKYIFTEAGSFQLPYVPKPLTWQFIWLMSLLPSLVGYFSLSKNTLSLLKFYYYGNVLLGLGTCLTTMFLNASDLLEFNSTKEATNYYNDFPLIVLWFIFLFIAVQIHAFGIYYSRLLIQLWTKEVNRVKKDSKSA